MKLLLPLPTPLPGTAPPQKSQHLLQCSYITYSQPGGQAYGGLTREAQGALLPTPAHGTHPQTGGHEHTHTHTCFNEAFPHPTAMQASFCSCAILQIPRRTYRHTHLDPMQQCNIPHLCPASVHTHSCPPAATPLPALHAPALACTHTHRHSPQPQPHIPHRAAEGHCPATGSASSCLVQDTQGSKTHH